MINLKIEVSGDAAKKLLNASDEMLDRVDKALLAASIMLEGNIKKKISRGGRSGTTYGIGGKRAQRSAPGEPPKSDTGRLVSSISHERMGFLNYAVGANVHYAGYLELGTRKMAARPYLQPTLKEHENEIEQMVLRAMQESFD